MATLQEIRQQYPQYNDLSDGELAGKLHQKFYSDMPREEFDRRVGLQPQSWGEYAGGLARQAAQGLTFSTADEIEAFLRSAGGANYGETVERIRRSNERFASENPVASVAANIAGGAPLFALGPGAAAARWVSAARSLPGVTARSAGLGAGIGAASGAGAGEGSVGDRLGSAATGAALGAGIGAAIPPVASAVGRVASTVAPTVQRVVGSTRRVTEEPPFPPVGATPAHGPPTPEGLPPRQPPITGATFIDHQTQEALNAQEGALRLFADQLLREGKSVADVERILAQARSAGRYHSSGRAQNAVALADVSPGLQRMAGSVARQSPEAAQDMSQFIAARQTGFTPAGTNARDLAQRGIPSRERFSQPMTGAQAERQLGSRFATPEGSVVPMGQRERLTDAARRMFLIEDSDFHGHAANPFRTEAQILQAARDEAQPLYSAAYQAGNGVSLRPTIQPIMERWATVVAEQPRPVRREFQRALQLFRTDSGELVDDIQRFDVAKQYMDDQIEKLLRGGDRRLAGRLIELKNELLAAVDSIPNLGSAYQAARNAFSDRMTARDILTRFRDAWRDDSDVTADAYAALTSPEQQKLARLGLLWGFEKQTAGTEASRDLTRVFNNPRVQELLTATIPRSQSSSATFADRPQRFGRYLDFERSMLDTRNTALGGSATARNIQDDLTMGAMEAAQNVQGWMDMFRGSTSMWHFGQRIFERIIDRAFGMGADRARELARILFTANPEEQAAILRRVAAMMPANRMARFNELMQRVQRAGVGPSAAAGANAITQPPSGPVSL